MYTSIDREWSEMYVGSRIMGWNFENFRNFSKFRSPQKVTQNESCKKIRTMTRHIKGEKREKHGGQVRAKPLLEVRGQSPWREHGGKAPNGGLVTNPPVGELGRRNPPIVT